MIEKCQFSSFYYDYEQQQRISFNCNEESFDSGLCIFHVKNDSIRDKIFNQKIIEKFGKKVKKAVDSNEKLLCFGYQLPYFRFADFLTNKQFTKPIYFKECHFLTKANFSGVTYQESVDFSGSIFESDAEFSGATFKGISQFSCKFQGSLTFSDANFKRQAAFSGALFHETCFFQSHFEETVFFKEAKFIKRVDFFNTTFCQEADFCDAQFQDVASFSGTHFQNVYYRSAQFHGEADFSNVQFQGPADFSNAHFQDVDFSRATFIREVNFSNSLFNGHITFSEQQFSKSKPDFDKPNFSKAKYLTKVDFSNQTFPFGANFKEVQFKNVDFFKTIFNQYTDFSETKFQDLTTFIETEFHERVDFTKSQFLGPADFSKAQFKKVIDFSKCKFHEIDFSETKFNGITNFSWSEFNDRTFFSGKFNNETCFNYVLFGGKEKVIFGVENMSFVSLLNTDIIHIRFSDATKWTDEEVKFKVFDERRLEKIVKDEQHEKNSNNLLVKDINLGSIKAVYRSLRENYEYRRRYDEAGQFFIREMELKRMYKEATSKDEGEANSFRIKKNNWFKRNVFSLTGWYYHLSRYGESLWRPTLAGVAIVFLSTLFWLIQVNPNGQPSFTNTVGFTNATDITIWESAFERSMADFLPLLSMPNNVQVGLIDFIIKIVGGAVTFGLIAIALRRKFERKYTH